MLFIGLEQNFPADAVYNEFQVQLDTTQAGWEQEQAEHDISGYAGLKPDPGQETLSRIQVDTGTIIAVSDKINGMLLPAGRFSEFSIIDQLLDLFQSAITDKWLTAASRRIRRYTLPGSSAADPPGPLSGSHSSAFTCSDRHSVTSSVSIFPIGLKHTG